MKNKLTKEEQIRFHIGQSLWESNGLGGKLPVLVMSDGPVGVRHPEKDPNSQDCLPMTAYPSIVTLAQSWDPSLARKMGKAIGVDCVERSIDVLFAPGVNIKRVPYCGRNFEYVSEDPLLAGLFGKAYIEGLQEEHVGACLKHYCCNNFESSRNWCSSEVDERTLHELYLRPFEIALAGEPWMVMCSYNLVNGVRMSENKELFHLLRKEFSFRGVVVSDYGAVKDPIKSINAGLDLEMPFDPSHLSDSLKREKEVDDFSLKEETTRLLDLLGKNEEEKKKRIPDLSLKEREKIADEIASEGIVLLKNNGVLPLKKESKVVVTGPSANRYFMGGGSAHVEPKKPFEGLCEALKGRLSHVLYTESIEHTIGGSSCAWNMAGAFKAISENDVAILCVGDDELCESEDYDRQTIRLSREQEDLIRLSSKLGKRIIVAISAGSAIDMSGWIKDVDAVLFLGYAGEDSSESLARILIGEVNPSGKLTESFPLSGEDVKACQEPFDYVKNVYGEGLEVGYRYFSRNAVKTLFPFGFGLSYSSFFYSSLKCTLSEKGVDISFVLENTSGVLGKEIYEVYRERGHEEARYQGMKELVAFGKVELKPKEKKTIQVRLDFGSFRKYDVQKRAFVIQKGENILYVGSSSEDLPLSQKINLGE